MWRAYKHNICELTLTINQSYITMMKSTLWQNYESIKLKLWTKAKDPFVQNYKTKSNPNYLRLMRWLSKPNGMTK